MSGSHSDSVAKATLQVYDRHSHPMKKHARNHSKPSLLSHTSSSTSTQPSLFPNFNNYSNDLAMIKGRNMGGSPSRTVLTKKSNIVYRPKSPDKDDLREKWSFLVGGKYNSPKCINLDHDNIKSYQYLRRSVFQKDGLIISPDDDTNPYLRERRKERERYDVKNHFKVSDRSVSPLLKDRPDGELRKRRENKTPVDESTDSPTETNTEAPVATELPAKPIETHSPRYHTPRLETDIIFEDPSSKLPRIKPKKTKKKRPKHDLTELSYRDFDRATMAQIDNEEYDKLLDPNNFPPDLYHTIDYLRTRKNMMRNNYKNFENRSQRKFTAYRHFVNYKMALEATFEQEGSRKVSPKKKRQQLQNTGPDFQLSGNSAVISRSSNAAVSEKEKDPAQGVVAQEVEVDNFHHEESQPLIDAYHDEDQSLLNTLTFEEKMDTDRSVPEDKVVEDINVHADMNGDAIEERIDVSADDILGETGNEHTETISDENIITNEESAEEDQAESKFDEIIEENIEEEDIEVLQPAIIDNEIEENSDEIVR